mmetsp:Transcript_47167/g.132986  ORF Transcript_47167/g.132986 Transcript_47167/m.132986 type:complete len:278 (-) Transcript_47167:452-1285(-)
MGQGGAPGRSRPVRVVRGEGAPPLAGEEGSARPARQRALRGLLAQAGVLHRGEGPHGCQNRRVRQRPRPDLGQDRPGREQLHLLRDDPRVPACERHGPQRRVRGEPVALAARLCCRPRAVGRRPGPAAARHEGAGPAPRPWHLEPSQEGPRHSADRRRDAGLPLRRRCREQGRAGQRRASVRPRGGLCAARHGRTRPGCGFYDGRVEGPGGAGHIGVVPRWLRLRQCLRPWRWAGRALDGLLPGSLRAGVLPVPGRRLCTVAAACLGLGGTDADGRP